MDYPISIFPLAEDDGGGYLGVVPDLLGCMSDGATPAEALANTMDAVSDWLKTAERRGMKIPEPGSSQLNERAYREHLLTQLKDVRNSVDHVEDRLDELQRAIQELQERQDHEDRWARFAEMTNLAAPPRGTNQVGNC
jgi:antitoxin HicB